MAFDPNKVNLGADLLTNPTASDRDPWQEAFKRFSAVPDSKTLRASEALSGMTGSWAAQYKFGPTVSDSSTQPEPTTPSNFSMKLNKLGRPGMPEIDFVPYSHNTNRFGNKGGALLGEPISFSVVGPTAKVGGEKMVWQWVVDITTVPGSTIVRLDDIVVDTSIATWSTTALTLDISDYYNIQAADFGEDARFDGGLYLMVSETGKTEEINPAAPVTGGIGDGAIIDDGITTRVPITALTSSSKTELFRVTGLYENAGNVLGFILDTSKYLESYFSIQGNPAEPDIIRHITLVEPAATRLVAIPDSGDGRGQEQVFAFTPPRQALTSEHQPLANEWNPSASPWPAEYPWGVEASDGLSLFYYDYGPQLPVLKPYAEWSDVYLTNSTVWAAANGILGSMDIIWSADATDGEPVPEVGDVLKIHSIKTNDSTVWVNTDSRSVKWGSLLGFFEVIVNTQTASTSYTLTLKRYAEVEPETGNSMWGTSIQFSADVTTFVPQLKCSIHKPVKELWNSPWFDADSLDSTRITNLIDPRWVERAGYTPTVSTDPTVRDMGVSPYRPDRAIFDTASSGIGAAGTNANPGNLQNLGFRVVLFPGKIKTIPTALGGTEDIIAPDWDRPITSNELVIDPTVTEKQYVEVDYANGFVRLSHPPQAVDVSDAGAGDLAPADDIFTLGTDDNPRGEQVLFAACVPYTQDIGQIGTGPRVTSNPSSVSDTDACAGSANSAGSGEFYDVYGDRVAFDVDTISEQVLNCINVVGTSDEQLTLTGLVADQLPPTGFFEIFQSGDPVLTTGSTRGSLFSYYGIEETGGDTILHGVHGGLESGVDIVTINSAAPAQIILRRELFTPNDRYGTATVRYQDDVSYGDAKRAGVFRFTGVETVVNLDGSITIQIQDSAADAYDNLGDLFSSWVLDGGELTGHRVPTNHDYISYTETTVIYQGHRLVIPAGEFWFAGMSGDGYLYIDGSDCSVNQSDNIPLPDPEFILLGAYTQNVFAAPFTFDLRHPLLDIDRRLDIFVGLRNDGSGVPLAGPHFSTLTDAVTYANEIQNPLVGEPDFRVRIRVVGYTDEPEAGLPIMIGTDGLMIESDPLLEDAIQTSITWDADDKCLIDLNGHDDLTFDGLSCHNTSTDLSQTEPLRALFTNTGGSVERLTVNNCRLVGSQGFMVMTANPIEDSHITNNYGEELLDFGIYLTNESDDPITMTITEVTTINVDAGETIDILYGGESLTVTDLGGTITYNVGTDTCTVANDPGAGDSFIIKPNQTARIIANGGGSIVRGADTIAFEENTVGSIFHSVASSVVIQMAGRLLERTVIQDNTFIQAGIIGNMADNDHTLAVAVTATITTTAGFDLRIGDASKSITIPAGTSSWVIDNDGTDAKVWEPPGPSLQVVFPADMDTAAFYPVPGSTGTATISIPGQEDIVMTPDTWGYMYYSTGVAPTRELRIVHGPNGVATAGGIVAYTGLLVTPYWDLLVGSVMVNMHNKINHNIIKGFHVGIFANVIWNSDVENNYISDTKNVGIYLGAYAGYHNTNNNVLENVFTVDQLDIEIFQWPGQFSVTPVLPVPTGFGEAEKHGLVASGLYSEINSNVISTAAALSTGEGTPPSYPILDIWMFGGWLDAKLNTLSWCLGGEGYALGVEDNTILSYGGTGYAFEAGVVISAAYSTIRGNSCTYDIILNESLGSVIAHNFARDVYTANPNLAVAVGSSYTNLTGNRVKDIYLNGPLGDESTNCTVDANTTSGSIFNGDPGLGPNGTRIVNNMVGTNITSFTNGTNANILGNTVLGTIDVNADGCIVSNNYATTIDVNAVAGPPDVRKVILMGNNAQVITGETAAATPNNVVAIGNTVSVADLGAGAGLNFFGHDPTGVHNSVNFEEAHNRTW